MFALVVRFTVRSECLDDFDALVERTLVGIGEEPGTLVYLTHERSDVPNERIFYEAYADAEAFAAHERYEHTKRFLADRADYLAAEPEVWWLTGLDGTLRTPD